MKNIQILSKEVQIIQRIGIVGNKFCGGKILFGESLWRKLIGQRSLNNTKYWYILYYIIYKTFYILIIFILIK